MAHEAPKPALIGTGFDGICLAASGQTHTKPLPEFQAEILALRARRLSRRFQLPPAVAAVAAAHAFGPLNDHWIHLGDAVALSVGRMAEDTGERRR